MLFGADQLLDVSSKAIELDLIIEHSKNFALTANIEGLCDSSWSTLISAAIAKADKRYLLFEDGSIFTE